ncbi:unnamed protein product [Rodentolepis nana]|uniref:Tetraspanin n=1 Tax=Rodentolepis nana TaxID=102285 RepID=A0A158QGJ6_RODNA|nr:unnamed protein product [Rodentolepis nana]
MGLILVIGSVVSLSNKYWDCAVLNIYYTNAWLCLGIGIVQVLLGLVLSLFVYLQPKCDKKDNLILVGPEGNQVGEIVKDHVQSTKSRRWTLQSSPKQQKLCNRCRSNSSRCRCCLCCCGNDKNDQSAFSNTALWFRPSAIIFLFILAGHIAAISLTASLISQAQSTHAGLSPEVQNIFIEAKSVFIWNKTSIATSAAAKCWERLESQGRCCGVDGPEDWLLEDSTDINRQNNQLDWMKQQCSCSQTETGICETLSFNTSSGKLQSITIYSRGCRGVIVSEVLYDLIVLRVLVPLSFSIILFTCILCVCVTLRVAHLEMGNETNRPSNQIIENDNGGYRGTNSLPRSFMSAPPNPVHAPSPLSNVTGIALRSLSLDNVTYQDASSLKSI